MIVVHIITKKREQALEIIDILLEKKLLFNAIVSRKKAYFKDVDTGELTGTIHSLIIGKTKSLLFNSINELLNDQYGAANQMPSLYCLPIIYMDPNQADELRERTLKV